MRWRTWGRGLVVVVVVVGCCSSQKIRKGKREGKKEKAVEAKGGKLESVNNDTSRKHLDKTCCT